MVTILVVFGAIAAIVVVLLVTQSHSASPGKALAPPISSGAELKEAGTRPADLGRFNLRNSSAPSKQEVMRVVKAWVEGKAALEEARLAIALWRNSSAATSGH